MTYYEVLDLPPASTLATIKMRYRDLARSKHPDLGGSDVEFAAITEAGSALTDIVRRLAYDAKLRMTMDPCPKCEGRGDQTIQISFTRVEHRRCSVCGGKGFNERRATRP